MQVYVFVFIFVADYTLQKSCQNKWDIIAVTGRAHCQRQVAFLGHYVRQNKGKRSNNFLQECGMQEWDILTWKTFYLHWRCLLSRRELWDVRSEMCIIMWKVSLKKVVELSLPRTLKKRGKVNYNNVSCFCRCKTAVEPYTHKHWISDTSITSN